MLKKKSKSLCWREKKSEQEELTFLPYWVAATLGHSGFDKHKRAKRPALCQAGVRTGTSVKTWEAKTLEGTHLQVKNGLGKHLPPTGEDDKKACLPAPWLLGSVPWKSITTALLPKPSINIKSNPRLTVVLDGVGGSAEHRLWGDNSAFSQLEPTNRSPELRTSPHTSQLMSHAGLLTPLS